MFFKSKIISVFIALIIIFSSFTFSVGALFEKETAVEKFYSQNDKLLCISYRGDTTNYPENSIEGVKSALKKGADFVSVNLEKTADGVFYLCESESLGNVCDAPYENLSEISSSDIQKYYLYDVFGNLTKYKMASLEELLIKTDSMDGIILDVKSDDKDAVYDVLASSDALSRVFLRVKESGSSLVKWAAGKDNKVYVIGMYTGNIIFSTVSQVNTLTEAEMPAVQYQSKNYFNVCFGEFFANRYLTEEYTRAIAATYSLDLCGQRGDGSDCWNELIGKGYSVIETNNIEAFDQYRSETERFAASISELLSKCSEIDTAKYSQVSIDNLTKAEEECRSLLTSFVYSLDEAQRAYSELAFALGDMKISTGEVDTRGALNITAGKVIAAILIGILLFSGQIYVYRMRRSKKEKIS